MRSICIFSFDFIRITMRLDKEDGGDESHLKSNSFCDKIGNEKGKLN